MASQFPAGNSPAAESTPAGEQAAHKNRGKKRRRDEKEGYTAEGKKKKGNAVKVEAKKKEASPVDRPSRERKTVERYAAVSPRRVSATKALLILQGPGEKLKDIPNVAFKLSKRKADECLHILHTILFGRKANVHYLRRNILQFSGFAWSQNEEKDRSKVQEKLNKCNKDRLLEFCHLLDIYTVKASTKKEEISVKLLEFLESPHVTRETVLEKDKKDKKRRRAKGNGRRALEEASSEKEKKRKKRDVKGEGKQGRRKPVKADEEVQVKGDSIGTYDESADEDRNDDAEENSEHSMSEADEENENEPGMTNNSSDGEETNEHEEPESKEKFPSTKKVSHRKGPFPSDTKKSDSEGEAKVPSGSKRGFSRDTKAKVSVKKIFKDNSKGKASQKKGEAGSGSGQFDRCKKVDNKKGKSDFGTSSKDSRGIKKQTAKADTKNVGKKKGKDVYVEPTAEQMHAVLSKILKEADFNVATLADIIKQLGAHFNMDLMHRKTEIKSIMQEVINNMTDDEDDQGDDDSESESEKN